MTDIHTLFHSLFEKLLVQEHPVVKLLNIIHHVFCPLSALWSASGLTLSSLKVLDTGNKIDVDGNALALKLGAGKSSNELLNLMSSYLKDLAHSDGFIVTVVLDSNTRTACKRDSWERKKQCELEDINRMYCRMETLRLNSKIKSDQGIENDRLPWKRNQLGR